MTRYQPADTTYLITDHAAKPGAGQWSWQCTVCRKYVNHHLNRWERFLKWVIGA